MTATTAEKPGPVIVEDMHDAVVTGKGDVTMTQETELTDEQMARMYKLSDAVCDFIHAALKLDNANMPESAREKHEVFRFIWRLMEDVSELGEKCFGVPRMKTYPYLTA
jgi:hypothetical protein